MPLVLLSLIAGITKMSDLAQLSSLGKKAIVARNYEDGTKVPNIPFRDIDILI